MIKITEAICINSKCNKKGEIFYLRDNEPHIICGSCKNEIKGRQLTESEVESIFDYDLTIGGLGS